MINMTFITTGIRTAAAVQVGCSKGPLAFGGYCAVGVRDGCPFHEFGLASVMVKGNKGSKLVGRNRVGHLDKPNACRVSGKRMATTMMLPMRTVTMTIIHGHGSSRYGRAIDHLLATSLYPASSAVEVHELARRLVADGDTPLPTAPWPNHREREIRIQLTHEGDKRCRRRFGGEAQNTHC